MAPKGTSLTNFVTWNTHSIHWGEKREAKYQYCRDTLFTFTTTTTTTTTTTLVVAMPLSQCITAVFKTDYVESSIQGHRSVKRKRKKNREKKINR